MHTEKTYDTFQRIYLYDGYQGEPIWSQTENRSTYYDGETDKQCQIPLPSREQLEKTLGIK